ARGLDAYYSKCVTLTLERRAQAPANGKVFMVGLSKGGESAVPRSIRKRAVLVDQAKLRLPGLSPLSKERLAQDLLDTYAREASLVITSKIHCAMPCIAMGIPVVFLYDEKRQDDYRVGIIEDLIGINYVGESWFARTFGNHLRSKRINWAPVAKDIEEEKVRIKTGYLEAFEHAAARYATLPLSQPWPESERGASGVLRRLLVVAYQFIPWEVLDLAAVQVVTQVLEVAPHLRRAQGATLEAGIQEVDEPEAAIWCQQYIAQMQRAKIDAALVQAENVAGQLRD
ncbi:MAG: hypothetical protein ACRERW_10010, partial [Pseudomonas sp.]